MVAFKSASSHTRWSVPEKSFILLMQIPMLSNVVEDIFLVFISKMRSYSFIVVEWFTVCLLICWCCQLLVCMCICTNNISGDKVCSRSSPRECRAVIGMLTTAAQLETSVKFYETWRHSVADGACVHGDWLDVICWKVSFGFTLWIPSVPISPLIIIIGKIINM